MKKDTKQAKSAAKPASTKKASKPAVQNKQKTTGKSPTENKKSVKSADTAKQTNKPAAKKPAPVKTTAKPAAKTTANKKVETSKNVAASSKKATAATKATTSKPTATSGLITVDLKFHPDSNGGHHHIIVEDLGDNHVSVGLTTNPKYDTKHKNVPLEHSPLSNQKQSYASRKGTVDKKNNYNSPKQGQITKTDKTKVTQIADKAKAKAIKKANK